jgi:hypothetical protein
VVLGIGNQLVNSFISKVIDPMIDHWLWMETEKVLATAQGQAVLNALGLRQLAQTIMNDRHQAASGVAAAATRTSAATAGAAAGVAAGRAAAAQQSTTDAIMAAKGAYATAAQIQPFGFILAPIAATLAFAAVEAFGSFEQGAWSIPGARENGLQLGGGGGRGGANVTMGDMHYHGQTGIEPDDFRDALDEHKHAVAGAVAEALRGGFRPSYDQPTNRL